MTIHNILKTKNIFIWLIMTKRVCSQHILKEKYLLYNTYIYIILHNLLGGFSMAQIAEIIKYEGDNSTFIWKHPCEDFNSLTQLIVHESQEAVFFMNGQALDLFGPGRYTL